MPYSADDFNSLKDMHKDLNLCIIEQNFEDCTITKKILEYYTEFHVCDIIDKNEDKILEILNEKKPEIILITSKHLDNLSENFIANFKENNENCLIILFFNDSIKNFKKYKNIDYIIVDKITKNSIFKIFKILNGEKNKDIEDTKKAIDNLLSQNELQNILCEYFEDHSEISLEASTPIKRNENKDINEFTDKIIDINKDINLLIESLLLKFEFAHSLDKSLDFEYSILKVKYKLLEQRMIAKQFNFEKLEEFLNELLEFMETRFSYKIEKYSIFTIEILKWNTFFVINKIINKINQDGTDQYIDLDKIKVRNS